MAAFLYLTILGQTYCSDENYLVILITHMKLMSLSKFTLMIESSNGVTPPEVV